MTLVLELSGGLESRLKNEAERHGLPAPEYARQLIEAALPADVEVQKKLNRSTLDLLAKWSAQTATTDPEELARRDRELEEFQAAMNKSRLESDGPDARVPFP